MQPYPDYLEAKNVGIKCGGEQVLKLTILQKYKLDTHNHMWREVGQNKGGHIKSMQSSKNVKNALWRRKQVENLQTTCEGEQVINLETTSGVPRRAL